MLMIASAQVDAALITGTVAALAIISSLVTTALTLRQQRVLARGQERQSLRLVSYGELWSRMRPLALFGGRDDIDHRDAAALSSRLSDWYFSEHGGFLLTTPLREL